MAIAEGTNKTLGLLFFFLATVILCGMLAISSRQLSSIVVNENFKAAASNRYELLYFTKSGCPHCVAFEASWTSLVACIDGFLKGDGRNCDVTIATLKLQVEQHIADLDKYNVTGVPHLVLKKPAGDFVAYNGKMAAPNVIAWLNTQLPCSITCVLS